MNFDIPFRRFAAFADLTALEEAALRDLSAVTTNFRRNHIIRYEQDPVDGVYLLVNGWALTTAGFAGGERQVLKIHLPGDIMGAPSLALDRAAETITAVTDVVVSKVAAQKLSRIFAELPRLSMLFFLAAQEERVELMDRLMILGRRPAKEGLAGLLVYLYDRLPRHFQRGLPAFELPLNQSQIGDFLGIHTVHVNRMFRVLEDEGLIVREGRWIVLAREADLRSVVGLPDRRLVRDASWLPPAP